MKRRVPISILLAAAWLAGCTSVPESIRSAPAGAPTLAQAREDSQRLAGSEVRWGGTIAAVENRAAETRLEIVERPLDSDGEPRRGDRSQGRFIASVPGFLDPSIYAEKRSVTVTGRLAGTVKRPIGEHPYTFPLVRVQGHYLWPERTPYPPSPPAYWCDPWPCSPYCRYPLGPMVCW